MAQGCFEHCMGLEDHGVPDEHVYQDHDPEAIKRAGKKTTAEEKAASKIQAIERGNRVRRQQKKDPEGWISGLRRRAEETFASWTDSWERWTNVATRFNEQMQEWLKGQVRSQVEKYVAEIPTQVKKALIADKDLSKKIWFMQCYAIDEVWHDVQKEILRYVHEALNITAADGGLHSMHSLNALDIDEDDDRPMPPRCLQYLRYAIFPHNKGFYGKLRNAWWVVYTIMLCAPMSAVSALAFLFSFIIIDKSDFYQLANFICLSKGVTFFSQGLIRTWAGYLMFFNCVTVENDTNRDGPLRHTCESRGPGTLLPTYMVVTTWLLQISLAYICYGYLIFASSRMKSQAEREDRKDEDVLLQSSRKRMKRFMIYDVVCLIMLLVSLAAMFSVTRDPHGFVFQQTLCAVQALFGLLAMPWFLVCLPGLQNMLLHCQCTAYDETGRIQPYKGPERKNPPKPQDSEKKGWQRVGVKDSDELLGKLCQVVGKGGSSEILVSPLAHDWKESSWIRPVRCSICKIWLTGIRNQGMQCQVCSAAACAECSQSYEGNCPDKEAAQQYEEDQAEKNDTDQSQRYSDFMNVFKVSPSTLKTLMSSDPNSEGGQKMTDVLHGWAKKEGTAKIEQLITQVPKILKFLFQDPDMPLWIKIRQHKLIDRVWEDVHKELMYQVKVGIKGTATEELDNEPDRNPFLRFRAKIRHSFIPCNRSIFWQLKNPVFILMYAMFLIPVAGLLPIAFLFLFIMIDKKDEYQLILFILRYKGCQFVSHGFVKAIVGYFQYYACSTAKGSKDDHYCEVYGPGSYAEDSIMFEVTVFSWVFMIILVWAAFLLLKCSKEKGRLELADENTESGDAPVADDKKTKVDAEDEVAGGKFRYLVYFDMIWFFVCLFFFIRVVVVQKSYKTWLVMQTFYACNILYGIMAFPFFVFNFPVLQEALTHSVPTGYDEKGRVKPYEAGPVRSDEEIEECMKEYEERKAKKLNHEKVGGSEEEEVKKQEDQAGTKAPTDAKTHIFEKVQMILNT